MYLHLKPVAARLDETEEQQINSVLWLHRKWNSTVYCCYTPQQKARAGGKSFLTQILARVVSVQSSASSENLHLLWSLCAGDFKMHFMVKYAQWFLLIKSSTAATGLRFILSNVVFFYLLVMLRSTQGSDPAKIISSDSFYFTSLHFLGYFTVWFLGCFSMQLNLLLAQHLWNKDWLWELGEGFKVMLKPALVKDGASGEENLWFQIQLETVKNPGYALPGRSALFEQMTCSGVSLALPTTRVYLSTTCQGFLF